MLTTVRCDPIDIVWALKPVRPHVCVYQCSLFINIFRCVCSERTHKGKIELILSDGIVFRLVFHLIFWPLKGALVRAYDVPVVAMLVFYLSYITLSPHRKMAFLRNCSGTLVLDDRGAFTCPVLIVVCKIHKSRSYQ